MTQTEIEDVILELLANVSSSFAALYGYVVRQAPASLSVDGLFAILAELEHRKAIQIALATADGTSRSPTDLDRARATAEYRRWLDGVDPSELTPNKLVLDEVGIWIEITPVGWTELRARAADRDDRKWMLDQDEAAKTITIHAADVELAESVLLEWMERHPNLRLSSNRTIEYVSEFRLGDGSFIKSGVRLYLEYSADGHDRPVSR